MKITLENRLNERLSKIWATINKQIHSPGCLSFIVLMSKNNLYDHQEKNHFGVYVKFMFDEGSNVEKFYQRRYSTLPVIVLCHNSDK